MCTAAFQLHTLDTWLRTSAKSAGERLGCTMHTESTVQDLLNDAYLCDCHKKGPNATFFVSHITPHCWGLLNSLPWTRRSTTGKALFWEQEYWSLLLVLYQSRHSFSPRWQTAVTWVAPHLYLFLTPKTHFCFQLLPCPAQYAMRIDRVPSTVPIQGFPAV